MREQVMFNPEMETLTPEEKFKLQSESLVKAVNYVYERQPLYRKRMDEAGVKPSDIHTIDDIVKLPFTTKDDLKASYPFGMLCVDTSEVVHMMASSGTTGDMKLMPLTAKDVRNMAEGVARNFYRAHVDKSSILHNAFNYGLSMSGFSVHYANQLVGAMEMPVSSGNTKRQLKLLKDTKATVLFSTPSYALRLIEEMDEEGLTKDDLNLKSGIFAGEACSDANLRKIEDRLGLTSYDTYGNSETSIACGTCDYKCGIHYPDDLAYPEIIDPVTLKQLKPGQKGELVVTTFLKEGVPLIRYRMGDITAIHDEKCKCGRTSVRLERIQGRVDDMITIRGGNVFPTQVELAILKCDFLNGMFHITVFTERGLDVMQVETELVPEAYAQTDRYPEFEEKLNEEIKAICGVKGRIVFKEPMSLPREDGLKQKVLTDLRNK